MITESKCQNDMPLTREDLGGTVPPLPSTEIWVWMKYRNGSVIFRLGTYHCLSLVWQTFGHHINIYKALSWLVWLSGLSAGLRTKESPVWFPVRAHAWVAGQVPSRGCVRGNHTLMFLTFSFFLLPSLKINKILEKWLKWKILYYIYFTTIKF